MNGKQVFTMSTKVNSRAEARSTAVTVNLDGATDEQVLNLALRQLRVDLAVKWREAGAIPSTFEYNLKDHGKGGSAKLTPEQVTELAVQNAKADPVKRAALIAQLQAMQ